MPALPGDAAARRRAAAGAQRPWPRQPGGGSRHSAASRCSPACAWVLQDRGGRILQQAVVDGFELANGRVSSVRCGGRQLGRAAVVIAAGPATAGA